MTTELFIQTFVSFLYLLNMSDAEVVNFTNQAVQAYVDYEVTGGGVRTLDNIIKYRVGDCSERAVLTEAILQEYGLDAKGVTGTLTRNETIGHAWVEVNINGTMIQHDRKNNDWLYVKEYDYVG